MLNELKNRGVKDILVICADGLSGMKEAVAAAYPQTELQRCIVHQVRNTLKYVGEKNKKEFANDLNIAPSTIGGYVQGVSEPDFETLKRIALYFNVSADYLLGIQENKTNSLAEVELLRVFRSMTNEQQQLFIEQGKVFTKANNKLKARKMTKSS